MIVSRHMVTLCTLAAICGFFAIPVAARACAEPNREATVTKAEQPEYPQSAKPLGLGPVSVQIAITVDPSGNIVETHVYKSSGNQAIDEAALKAASGSKYSPRLVNCQAVVGKYLFRSDFEPDTYMPVPADIPRGSEWENPFCNGSAIVVPWDEAQNVAAYASSSKTVAVFLWANADSDYAARVTLIGNGAAYTVDIPRTAIPNSPDGKRRRYAYLVSLPSPIFLNYYFVDGAGVDGAPVSDCPSFVKEVAAPTESDPSLIAAPASFARVGAKLMQTLPPQPCGSIYKGPALAKPFTPVIGFYGYGSRTAQVAAFIDSSGHAIRTEIWQSSGVPGIDAAALAAVQGTSYQPAQFLCTPVVSIAIFPITYEAR
ncbi:MAG: TonB family protein [Candidatus Cybelea sp.]